MVSDDAAVFVSDIADLDKQKFVHEGFPYNIEDGEELQNALRVSSEVDMTLAYLTEKLANLEHLLLLVLAGENDTEAIDFENNNVSAEFYEKAFTLDLLFAILNFELRELDGLVVDLQDLIVDTLTKISSCENSAELFTGLARKMHDSEDLLKRPQERLLEMKIQLAKLQMSSFFFKQNEYKHDLDMGVEGELHLATSEWEPGVLTSEKRRVLRMLELSLARELELENKLMELKQNEEDLKLKIQLIDRVAVCMEEAAEVAWGRFLEADNEAEVLMGISKEMLGKLQVVNSDVSSSDKREEEYKSKLQYCIHELNEKEALIEKLNSSIVQLVADNAEVTGLRERVQMLEQRLSRTELELIEASVACETSEQQLRVMEGEIESLREKPYAAESRAGSADEKVTQLTDSNLELTEELEFLRGSNDSNTKKVSLLEKQLRELDIQLQHSRASSEASQEQQNMLYSAIWDMETLIDELRQKVAKAENKTESAEERCVILSETNSELNKELDFLRSRMEFMEISLDQVTLEKRSSAKDISIRTGLIMDMVMQLAVERERIQKQLTYLTKENKLLREKLQKEQNNTSLILQDNRSHDDKELLPSALDSVDRESAKTSALKVTEVSSESVQVQKSAVDALSNENQTVFSSSASHSRNLVLKLEAESSVETGKSRRMYLLMATLILLLSILAAHLFPKRLAVFKPAGS
ncbi:WPP domain-interacting tail-anchored protein 2 isoform X2 [Sesamum indicum]|nr:WPP domain-interacting tail-anchored protein 2 isoform X2 [Sesamum indicum]